MSASLWRRLILPILLLATGPPGAWADGRGGFLLDVKGAIGPATADYFARALDRAEARDAELVVLRMDTPGGLDTAMRAIIKRIIAAEVPVVVWVAPGGARAASAGTYILYAGHIAAMAPGTNLGAATPVELGGLPGLGEDGHPSAGADGKQKTAPPDAKKSKIVNDAAAYIRGLARLHGRNAEWAERAVREAASLPAEEALKRGVIDLLAPDLDQLTQALDGREVQLPAGSRKLVTGGLRLEPLAPDWRSELLSIISNPNVAYILMLVGIYGLIYEFANPGTVLPGTAGAVSLLLALYAFQVLPVDYAGLALILLGLSLIAAEAFVPSFGALGVGGIIAFILGSLILIDTGQPGFGLSLPLVLTVAVASAALLVTLVGMALNSRRRPVVSGSEELVGTSGLALEDFDGRGTVRVHGEVWAAHGDRPLHKGQAVHVTGRDGLVLAVTSTDKKEGAS